MSIYGRAFMVMLKDSSSSNVTLRSWLRIVTSPKHNNVERESLARAGSTTLLGNKNRWRPSELLLGLWRHQLFHMARAFPAVSRRAGTHLTAGVCPSVTRSDLPWGLLLKGSTAPPSPSSFPSFDSSSRCLKTVTVVTLELIKFCGLLPLWSHFVSRI